MRAIPFTILTDNIQESTSLRKEKTSTMNNKLLKKEIEEGFKK
jgi:hypothetical protein